jgi:hypothetical protein
MHLPDRGRRAAALYQPVDELGFQVAVALNALRRSFDMLRVLTAAMAACLTAGFAAAYPAPAGNIDFKVLRGGDEIGHHRVAFSQDGASTVADIDIKLEVYLGPIRVYVYEHRSREIWQNGALAALDGTTNDDGELLTASVRREGDALAISGTAFSGQAEGALLPSSWWDYDLMQQSRIIDSQNGRVFSVAIQPMGEATLTIAGQQVAAKHYRVTGELALDIWYDARGNWVRSEFDGQGEQIVYELQALPQQQAQVAP